MAMKPWTSQVILAVAEDMEFVARKLRDVASEMAEKKFPELYLQAEAAFGVYRKTLVKLATDAESELRDQYSASIMGTLPRWKINQKFIEARDQAQADRIAKGIEPAKPAKAVKKKRPKSS